MNFVAIAAGGAVGALARYLVSLGVNLNVDSPFPFGTLAVNVTGSLAIGVLFALFDRLGSAQATKLLLVTGFLGAYTTFSSYSLETVRLLSQGRVALALGNFALNNALCLGATALGLALVRLLSGRA
jgi:CrcB protein